MATPQPPSSLTTEFETPHPEPKYQAVTFKHSNSLHGAANQLDDTIPIEPGRQAA